MASQFKVAKKDALSYTRTNISDLHEKKLEYFESEKIKLDEYLSELQSLRVEYKQSDIDFKYSIDKRITELETKIYNIEEDRELNDYLLDFYSIIKQYSDSDEYSSVNQKGQLDSFINSKINNSRAETYNEYIKTFNPELKEITTICPLKKECTNCKGTIFTFEMKSCSEICMDCGLSVSTMFVEENNPVYTENVEQVIVFN